MKGLNDWMIREYWVPTSDNQRITLSQSGRYLGFFAPIIVPKCISDSVNYSMSFLPSFPEAHSRASRLLLPSSAYPSLAVLSGVDPIWILS